MGGFAEAGARPLPQWRPGGRQELELSWTNVTFFLKWWPDPSVLPFPGIGLQLRPPTQTQTNRTGR